MAILDLCMSCPGASSFSVMMALHQLLHPMFLPDALLAYTARCVVKVYDILYITFIEGDLT